MEIRVIKAAPAISGKQHLVTSSRQEKQLVQYIVTS